MNLTDKGLQDTKDWSEHGYILPKFDRETMIQKTKEAPEWVHFGGGNLFRAFHAALAQDLLNAGKSETGVIVIEGYDYEIVEKAYRPNDNYSILVTLKSDGSIEKTVIGSISESCILDRENEVEFGRLQEIFSAPSLKLATFTITEKGYSMTNAKGEVLPAISKDLEKGPECADTYIGKVAALLYTRFTNGALPIAMVSTDNCSHNGDKLAAAIVGFARGWVENGLVSPDFLTYVQDETRVSFPWTMIDKITPRPDASVEAILKEDGLSHVEPVITSKNSYVAPFVNAEETQYLVVEDAFPNGKPALSEAGVIFTDRETVEKVEKMKVCTCLNPLHTVLAVYGCVLGYTSISAEMKDPELLKMVETIGYKEGLPVVVNPGVLDPKQFIDTVLQVRVPNPFMPDTPQRIATDTSQKLAIRFGETIKNYIKTGRDLADLKLIPLEFAGWIRYLMAIDDAGQKFTLSPDPMLPEVLPFVEGLELREGQDLSQVKPLLRNEKIWGLNLEEIGMADLVMQYLSELTAGVGAVRATLKKYTA